MNELDKEEVKRMIDQRTCEGNDGFPSLWNKVDNLEQRIQELEWLIHRYMDKPD